MKENVLDLEGFYVAKTFIVRGLEGLEMHGFSGLRGFYVAIFYCLVSDVIRRNSDFDGSIEEKVSGSEGCYVTILYCLRLGRVANAWIFRFERLLCSNSLLFGVGCYAAQW